jgi:hypothetical protein
MCDCSCLQGKDVGNQRTFTSAMCDMQKAMMCEYLGGKPKADFCGTNGPYCQYMGAQAKFDECSKDSDCDGPGSSTRICCTAFKAMFEKACDNIDAKKWAEYVKEQTPCYETDCTSSGSVISAGMLNCMSFSD